MNKKLFALLTSAAVVVACAPAVFAEANEANEVTNDVTATLEFGAPATVAEGEEATIDVYLTSSIQLCGVQFNFDVENGEIVDFVFDEATIKDLGFDDWGFTKEQSDDFKAQGYEDYAVMAVDTSFDENTIPSKTKIGTLTVKGLKEGDVISINTKNNLGNYDYGDAEAAWTTTPASVTVEAAAESTVESESQPDSTPDSVDSADSVSSTSSSESTSTSESSKATTNTSSKATNGTTNNTNTGAASTAAVALAASAAALVVISKKRK